MNKYLTFPPIDFFHAVLAALFFILTIRAFLATIADGIPHNRRAYAGLALMLSAAIFVQFAASALGTPITQWKVHAWQWIDIMLFLYMWRSVSTRRRRVDG